MAKKRIMRKFRISEISGVDVPAQQGARALIMKRGAVGANVQPRETLFSLLRARPTVMCTASQFIDTGMATLIFL